MQTRHMSRNTCFISASHSQVYIPALDGWRAIAILLVLFDHGSYFAKFLPFDVGAGGVSIFFVLSGFLITNRILKVYSDEGRVAFSRFYYHRLIRILPLVLVYILALSLLTKTLPAFPVTGTELVASLLFFRNYFVEPPRFVSLSGWYTGHFWSLAVEEHYYLLWPLILHLAGRRKAIFVAVAGAALCVLWRSAVWHYRPDLGYILTHVPFYCRTDTRIDGLLIGSAIALAIADPATLTMLQGLIKPRDSMVCVGLLTIVWLRAHRSFPGIPETLALAGLLLCTIFDREGWLARVLSWTPLTLIGKLSYSLYIWQQVLLSPRQGYAPWLAGPRILFVYPMLFGVAVLSFHFVEEPARRLGAKLYARTHAANCPKANAVARCQRASAYLYRTG